MKRRLRVRWIVGLVAVLVLAITCWIAKVAYSWSSGGPRHKFVLAEPPLFLTDELAVAKARESLALDGLDPNVWHLYPSERTTAPNGRADQFLARNASNPNQGTVRFMREGKGTDRFVGVELAGNRVTCHGSWGK
ncbi:MAG TPA: hypothetical protein VHR66_21345 [Gemmataceae bacterium]|jgi:hypothetical protein|nr:hypothetical protein [Gemmataceae bacterium]